MIPPFSRCMLHLFLNNITGLRCALQKWKTVPRLFSILTRRLDIPPQNTFERQVRRNQRLLYVEGSHAPGSDRRWIWCLPARLRSALKADCSARHPCGREGESEKKREDAFHMMYCVVYNITD